MTLSFNGEIPSHLELKIEKSPHLPSYLCDYSLPPQYLKNTHMHHLEQNFYILNINYKYFAKTNVGSWLHCGYHLTNSIVCPPLLSLPYAFTFLGWETGILCLAIAALVTFYSYNSISLVLEHHAQSGRRHLRFRDMAHDILGKFYVVIANFNLLKSNDLVDDITDIMVDQRHHYLLNITV